MRRHNNTHPYPENLSNDISDANMVSTALLFPEKEAESVVLLRRRLWAVQTSAKPTLGVWGLVPSKTTRYVVFFFSRKEAKALVLLRRRIF
jgi:hypothetical protein